jgi:hydroxymethylpyrimidine/phosphomethylpyrimidine kinase
MAKSEKQPICLTIAGVDPSGGAGIIADIKTFSAFGCFATAAIASITFQNTQGVFGAVNQSAESVRLQIQPILDDFEISAVKTGMLPTCEIIEEVARIISSNNLKNIVVDPVVRSTSGFDLIDNEALSSLIENLFPLSDLITPNLAEAERISQMKIENEADIEKAAGIMQGFGAKNVLIKGGHIPLVDLGIRNSDFANSIDPASIKEKRMAKDFLFIENEKILFESAFIETTSTHGTGCTLAAAIAANLALGKSLVEAVQISKDFVLEAIMTAPKIGKGNGPINHLANVG